MWFSPKALSSAQSYSVELSQVLFCMRSLVEALVTLKTESEGREVELDKEVELGQGGRAR